MCREDRAGITGALGHMGDLEATGYMGGELALVKPARSIHSQNFALAGVRDFCSMGRARQAGESGESGGLRLVGGGVALGRRSFNRSSSRSPCLPRLSRPRGFGSFEFPRLPP